MLSELIYDVLNQMNADDLMNLIEWARNADFQRLTWRYENADFMCDFDDFVDLSMIMSSVAINNVKRRWITLDFDELWGEFID